MRLRSLALAAGAFAVGTDAFVVAGVLPALAADLRVDVATAGQVVTVFALAYAIGAPGLAAVSARVPRKRLLIGALAIFVAGNVLSAAASSYGLLLVARVVAAAGAGLYMPTASTTVAALAAPDRRGRALAVVLGGMTSATVVGVPIGTWLGTTFGWPATFWFVAALGAVAAAVLAVVVPTVAAPPASGLRDRLTPLRDRRVVTVLATTTLFIVSGFTVFTYLAGAMAPATGGEGGRLALLLAVFGAAGVAGNVVAGRATDRYGAARVLIVGLAVLTVDLLTLPFSARTMPGAAAALAVWGVAGWLLTVPQQHRLFALAPAAGPLTVALNSSALYLGQAIAGVVGATGLRLVGATHLSWVAAPFALAALAVVTSSTRQRTLHAACAA
jgi:MFS transporter, DHA1 family, inner membrane transport protein